MAYSGEVLRYNSYGGKYEVPRKLVSSLDDLKSGDHIAFHRIGGIYWHHAIVDVVDKRSEKLFLIEYSNTVKGFLKDNFCLPKNPAMAKVYRKGYPFVEVTAVHLMLHECCYPAETVVERARSKIGKSGYNPFTYNCEHFAMWCKTGTSSSDQVNKAAQMVTEDITSEVAGTGVRATAEHVGRTVLNVATRAANKIPIAFNYVTEGIVGAATNLQKAGGELFAKMPPLRLPTGGGLPPLLSRGAATVANLPTTRIGSRIVGAATNLQEAGGTLLAKMPPLRLPTGGGLPPLSSLSTGAGTAAKLISRGGQAIGGVLAAGAIPALIEGLSVNHDLNNLQRDLGKKIIDGKQYDETVKKRCVTGVSNVTGATTGTLIGQAIFPVPVMGAAIGGVVGGITGRYVGNILGNLAFGTNGGDGANYAENSKEDSEGDLGGGGQYYYDGGADYDVEESDEDNEDVPVVGHCGRAGYTDNDDLEDEEDNFEVIAFPESDGGADNDVEESNEDNEDIPVVGHCSRAHHADNDDLEDEEDNLDVIAFPESDGGADYGEESDEDSEEGLGGGGYYTFSGADYADSNYVEDDEEDFSVAAYH